MMAQNCAARFLTNPFPASLVLAKSWYRFKWR